MWEVHFNHHFVLVLHLLPRRPELINDLRSKHRNSNRRCFCDLQHLTLWAATSIKATRPFSIQAKCQPVQETFRRRVNDLDGFSTAVPTTGRSSCGRQRSRGRRRIQRLSCCHLHGGLWISSTSLDYLTNRIEPTQNAMLVSINRPRERLAVCLTMATIALAYSGSLTEPDC